MKKLFLILLAVALLGSMAFAETAGPSAPSLTGSVETTFGYNLDESASGFTNDASVTLSLPLVSGGAEGMGEGDVYGMITLATGDVTIDGDGELEVGTDPSVEGKIVAGDLYVTVGDNPDLTTNFVSLDSSLDYNGVVGGEAGLAIGYATDAFSIEVGVASVADYADDTAAAEAEVVGATSWYDSEDESADAEDAVSDTINTANEYVFGLNGSTTFGDWSVPFAFSYDPTGDTQMSAGISVDGMAGPLTVSIPFDYVMVADASGMDLNPTVGVALEGLLSIDADFLYQAGDMGDNMAFGVTLTEAMMDALTAVVAFDMDLDDSSWALDCDFTFDAGIAAPYVNFDLDNDTTVGLNIGADLAVIDNATVNVDWASSDLTGGELGIVMAGVSISL